MIEVIRAHDAPYHPERVSVLSMTRGRPEQFLGLVENLGWVTAQPELTDIWCYIDDDDPSGQFLIDKLAAEKMALSVHWVRGPRPVTLGRGYNEVCRQAMKTSGLFFGFPEDYRIWSPGWDDALRKVYPVDSDRISLHYVPDPTAEPEQITVFAGSREWVETLGYLLPEWFPYWFGDSWLDEISTQAKVKRCLPLKIEAIGGKGLTGRMWNLPFWQRFFDLTLLDRLEDTLRLLQAKGDTPELEAEIAAKVEDFKTTPWKKNRTAAITNAAWQKNSADPIWLTHVELSLTAERGAPPPLYFQAELLACRHLMELYTRHPVMFSYSPPEDFDLEAVFRANETAGGAAHTDFSAVAELLKGVPLGLISARSGIGPGRLLEWRNALMFGLREI